LRSAGAIPDRGWCRLRLFRLLGLDPRHPLFRFRRCGRSPLRSPGGLVLQLEVGPGEDLKINLGGIDSHRPSPMDDRDQLLGDLHDARLPQDEPGSQFDIARLNHGRKREQYEPA
jgi:hypothetical protein